MYTIESKVLLYGKVNNIDKNVKWIIFRLVKNIPKTVYLVLIHSTQPINCYLIIVLTPFLTQESQKNSQWTT